MDIDTAKMQLVAAEEAAGEQRHEDAANLLQMAVQELEEAAAYQCKKAAALEDYLRC